MQQVFCPGGSFVQRGFGWEYSVQEAWSDRRSEQLLLLLWLGGLNFHFANNI